MNEAEEQPTQQGEDQLTFADVFDHLLALQERNADPRDVSQDVHEDIERTLYILQSFRDEYQDIMRKKLEAKLEELGMGIPTTSDTFNYFIQVWQQLTERMGLYHSRAPADDSEHVELELLQWSLSHAQCFALLDTLSFSKHTGYSSSDKITIFITGLGEVEMVDQNHPDDEE